jgi:hypothetical protein
MAFVTELGRGDFSKMSDCLKQKKGHLVRTPEIGKWWDILKDLVFRAIVNTHPTRGLRQFKKNAKRICRSELFDEAWYREQYKLRPSQNPALHYLTEGAMQGFEPNPLFSTRDYFILYPELRVSGTNPVLHLLDSGKPFKRIKTVTEPKRHAAKLMLHYSEQFRRIDPSRKTLVLVTHELSRTGAPILLLNLAKAFRLRYNIVLLSLNGGLLMEQARDVSDIFISPEGIAKHLHSELFLTYLFEEITAKTP